MLALRAHEQRICLSLPECELQQGSLCKVQQQCLWMPGKALRCWHSVKVLIKTALELNLPVWLSYVAELGLVLSIQHGRLLPSQFFGLEIGNCHSAGSFVPE